MNNLKVRRKWADVMKGIGIIAVVIGHQYSGLVHDFLYIFHLPLFFLLSAYFFKPQKNKIDFFLKQAKKLLLPYLIYLSIFFIFFYSREILARQSILEVLKLLSKFAIGGRALVSPLNVFWFITVLFATQQLFNFLIIKLSTKNILLLALLSYSLSMINSLLFQWFWLPLNLNVVFAVFPFFVVGYFYKQKSDLISKPLIVFFGILAIMAVLIIPNNTYDLKYSIYGVPILSFFCSIFIVLLIKLLSEKFENRNIVGTFLAEIGKASLVIMYLHVPIQYVIHLFLGRNIFLMTLIPIFLSLAFYYLARRNSLTRKLFLGS